MSATPARYNPDGRLLHWFEAQFSSGRCSSCGERINEGDDIAYTGDEGTRAIIRRDCCGLAAELYRESDNDREPRIAVMPPGGKRPACMRCFIIHTPAQGDQCE